MSYHLFKVFISIFQS